MINKGTVNFIIMVSDDETEQMYTVSTPIKFNDILVSDDTLEVNYRLFDDITECAKGHLRFHLQDLIRTLEKGKSQLA